MSNYVRVIPRDLFNEGDLLNLYGRLAILLMETPGHDARFEDEEVSGFDIVQDISGGLTVANLPFTVRGRRYRLERPLNTRSKWALFLTSYDDPGFDEISVFDEVGAFSEQMLQLISTPEVAR